MLRFAQDRLLQVRLDLGLTQEQAAQAIDTDVRTWRRYESGDVNRGGFAVRNASRRALLHRMSEAFGVLETEWLVGEEEPDGPEQPEEPAQARARTWEIVRWHTLQRARHFVGRDVLLASLVDWTKAAGPTARVQAVVAAGGTGKTALADRVVSSLSDPVAGGVLVWSFYEDPRVERFLEAALEVVGGAPTQGMETTLERLRAALAAGPPHLLVLDGLERVQSRGGGGRALGEVEAASVRRLLRALAAGLGNSRALVTSQLPLSDLAPWEGAGLLTTRLPQLPEHAARALLERWELSGDLSSVLQRVGCHALSLDMAGAYISGPLDGDVEGFAQVPLADAAEDEPLARRLSAILSAYAAALRPVERDLMARLAALPAGAELADLEDLANEGGPVAGALAGRLRGDLTRALDRLSRQGLAYSSPDRRWSAHPFVREFFRGQLGVGEASLFSVLARSLSRRLTDSEDIDASEDRRMERYERLLGYELRARRPTAAFRIYREAMGGFTNLGLSRGDWARGARVVAAFFEGSPQPAARMMATQRARLLYDQGLYTAALGDPAAAVRCYHAQLSLCDQLPQAKAQSWEVTGWRALAYTERLRGNTDAALTAIGHSLASARPGWEQVLGLAMRAAILHDMGRLEEASADFAVAEREHGSAPVARWGLWKAEHLMRTGRRTEARSLTQANLLECRLRGWPGHEAHCCLMLALLALPDAPGAAREHLQAAREWSDTTGEVEIALEARRVAVAIALAVGDDEEAQALQQVGLDDARACGFARLERLLALMLTQ